MCSNFDIIHGWLLDLFKSIGKTWEDDEMLFQLDFNKSSQSLFST